MVCNVCGKEVAEDAYFCPYCGTKLREYPLEVPLEEVKEEEAAAQETALATEEQPAEENKTEKKPENDMALIGFVTSFISPLMGAVFGGVGLARSLKRKGAGKGFSIAAIAIAAGNFLLSLVYEVYSALLYL